MGDEDGEDDGVGVKGIAGGRTVLRSFLEFLV